MVAGDTLVAVALAGSLFFDITPDAARWRIALYLLLTVAPFAVVAPMVGPALDRMKGGRRMVMLASSIGRAVVCAIMIRDVDTLLLFPEAFLLLVFSKSYAISKAALVPTVVHNDDELLEANAKLTLIGAIVGFVVMVPALPMLKLGGPEWVLGFASIIFVGAAVLALQTKKVTVADIPAGPQEKAELHSAGIVLAGTGMAVVRGIVGFLTFVVAFYIRNAGSSELWFAVVLAASGLGALLGAALTPSAPEGVARGDHPDRSALARHGHGHRGRDVRAASLFSATAAALVVGLGASGGKLAFDSIVQRDAPDANRGRSFAKFETRFQLAWVVGAFIPVIIPIPIQAGLLAISLGRRRSGRELLRQPPVPPCERQGARAAAEARRRDGRGRRRRGRSASSRKRAVARRRPGARAATAGGEHPCSTPVLDTTHPVAVTPPVLPLGGKRKRMTLPPPGQAELPLEPPAALVAGSVRGRCGRARGRARRSRPGVGSSAAEVHRRARPSCPARSTTPSTKVEPRCTCSRVSVRPSKRLTKPSDGSLSTRRRRSASVSIPYDERTLAPTLSIT